MGASSPAQADPEVKLVSVFCRILHEPGNLMLVGPRYLELNPDGRIPLLVDRDIIDPSTGRPAYLRESGAILLHLFERFDSDRK